jgi:hypothetical protein
MPSQSKITISVTSELLHELKVFRDVLNISEICRDAIQTRIDALKRGRDGVSINKTEIINRLRAEQELLNKADIDVGFAHGYEHCKILDISRIVRITRLSGDTGLFEHAAHQKWLWAIIDERIDTLGRPPIDETKYATGYVKGVTSFWNDIKSEL